MRGGLASRAAGHTFADHRGLRFGDIFVVGNSLVDQI